MLFRLSSDSVKNKFEFNFDENGFGVFIQCVWHLNSIQLNFIKSLMLRDEFKKNIKIRLNEVNI